MIKNFKFFIYFFISLIIFFISFFRVFEFGELIFYDLRLKLRPKLNINKDIVIIEIDDSSLEKFGKWPISRDWYAVILEILKEKEVKNVVFDILFSEKSSTEIDNVFSNKIKELSVYLAVVVKDKDNIIDILDEFKKNIHSFGHINTFVDLDGKIRRIPLFLKYKDKFIAHLALKVAVDNLGLNISNLEFKKNKIIIDKKLKLPLKDNKFLVNYPTKFKDSFKRISAINLINLYVKNKDLSFLKGKICFIGLTATGTSDLKATPLENLAPMVFLQASVYNSIVNKNFIYDFGFLNNILNIFVFFITIILFKRFSFKKIFGLLLFLFCFFTFATLLLVLFGILIDLFFPLLIISLTYLGLLIYQLLKELERRRLIEKELDIARKIQESFLPKDIKTKDFFSISHLIRPAKFVAGDLYDIFLLDDDKLSVFIGDVSGKGVPASLIMAQTISFFRIFSKNTDNPSFVLNMLNKELVKILSGSFLTALYLILDKKTQTIKIASGGHLPVILYSFLDKKIKEVSGFEGPPLGVLEDVEYENLNLKISKNDKILLYTDGVIEARNKKNEEFGIDRLKEVFLKNIGLEKKLDNIINEIFNFSKGAPQHDDITLILLEYF